MDGLLCLPNEVLIRVFSALPSLRDVLNFAAACSHLHQLLNDGGNRFRILRTAVGIPKSFADDLKRSTTGLAIVGPGEFLVRDGSDQVIHVKVDYEYFEEREVADLALLDVLSFRKHAPGTTEYDDAILAFCRQFHHVDSRCVQPVPLCVEDLLAAASTLQIEMLLKKANERPEKRTGLFSRDTVVALSLDILAIVQLVGIASYSRLIGTTDYVYTPARRSSFVPAPPISPAVEVRKLPAGRALKPLVDDQGEELTLESTLYRLCQLMQEVLGGQDPQDSVPMLYALCILRTAISDVDAYWSTWAGPMEKLAPQDETPMRRVWVDLCRLYFISTGGMYHPLRFTNLGHYPVKFWEDFPDEDMQSHFLRLNDLLVQPIFKQRWANYINPDEMQNLREFPFLVYRLLSFPAPEGSQHIRRNALRSREL